MLAYAGLAALIAGSAFVRADPVPTAPGPGDVFKVGGQCSFTWTADSTGVWKEMNVELMSGSNLQMNHITTVATLDGTDASTTSHTFDCPNVMPNSAIYFYQFSSPANVSAITWTTRFTIAAADGSTTAPANPKQPDAVGSPIPWGTGALVDPSTAVAAPSYLPGGASSAPATGGAGTTAAATSAPATTAPASSAPSSKSGFSTAPAAPSATSGAAATNGSSTNTTGAADNGALNAFGVDSYVARAGIALGVAAFTFAVAL